MLSFLRQFKMTLYKVECKLHNVLFEPMSDHDSFLKIDNIKEW